MSDPEGDQGELIISILFIPNLWFMMAQGVKRCHDVGRSDWWLPIPFYGIILLFSDGVIDDNKYGSNPKGINYEEDSNIYIPEPIDDVDEDGIIRKQY